jgi:bifunctional non-homologous end joining protein LigD
MEELVEVEGREIKLTHLDKILWQKERITKAELLSYYVTVAPFLLPIIRNRPLSVYRFPHGVGGGLSFVQKNWQHLPNWVKTFTIESERGKKLVNYILCSDLPTLVWLANMTAIEINQFLASVPKIDNHDLILFDLDPKYPADFNQAREVAYAIHLTLKELGLKHSAKTSGSDGIHILVSVKPQYEIEKIRDFVKRVGDLVASLMPKLATTSRDPREQAGRIYIDYRQNGLRMLIAAPFSVRPLPAAPVSFPLQLDDLSDEALSPANYTLRRILEKPSLLQPLNFGKPQSLKKALRAVGL